MRTVSRAAGCLQADPQQALLTEPQRIRCTDIGADHGVTGGQSFRFQKEPGASGTHSLLIAGQCQHDLTVPQILVVCQDLRRCQEAGNTGLHVGRASAVNESVMDLTGPGGFIPLGDITCRISIDMAVENQTLAGLAALQDRNDVLNRLLLRIDRPFQTWDRAQHVVQIFHHGTGVGRRSLAGDPNHTHRVFYHFISNAQQFLAQLISNIHRNTLLSGMINT